MRLCGTMIYIWLLATLLLQFACIECGILKCSKIGLRSHHEGKFVSVQPSGAVQVNRNWWKEWEHITVEDDPYRPGYVYLKSYHGRYLTAKRDGKLEWNTLWKRDWERFELVKSAGDKVALKSYFGKWVSAQPQGTLVANREKMLPWELFKIYPDGCFNVYIDDKFPSQMIGSLWTWAHDGTKANGWIELLPDGKVGNSWGPVNGHWEMKQDGYLLTATWSGIYHELAFNKQQGKATLQVPIRSTPSVMWPKGDRFPHDIVGSTWTLALDGVNPQAWIILLENGQIASSVTPPNGHWELKEDGTVVAVTWNGIYYEWKYDRHQRKATLKNPSSKDTAVLWYTDKTIVSVEAGSLAWPEDFRWSSAGHIWGWHCVQINEPSDPHTWQDNFFCSRQDIGMKWSFAGPIDGMKCTQIIEAADKGYWRDNYLCVPPTSTLNLKWSSAGPIPNTQCVQWLENADPQTWHDNYLCAEPSLGVQSLQAIVAENKPLFIACQVNHIIQIKSASYGKSLPDQHCHATTSDSVMSYQCNGKRSCRVTASNGIFGDPCVGVLKELRVSYVCTPIDKESKETVKCLRNQHYQMSWNVFLVEVAEESARTILQSAASSSAGSYHGIHEGSHISHHHITVSIKETTELCRAYMGSVAAALSAYKSGSVGCGVAHNSRYAAVSCFYFYE